jgi:hypothetical protein
MQLNVEKEDSYNPNKWANGLARIDWSLAKAKR